MTDVPDLGETASTTKQLLQKHGMMDREFEDVVELFRILHRWDCELERRGSDLDVTESNRSGTDSSVGRQRA